MPASKTEDDVNPAEQGDGVDPCRQMIDRGVANVEFGAAEHRSQIGARRRQGVALLDIVERSEYRRVRPSYPV